MPLIRDDGQLVRIALPADGEWVEVKARLTVGDNTDIAKSGMKEATFTSSGALVPNAAIAVEAIALARLNLVIKAWSFPDAVTPENIRLLDEQDVAVINAQLDELYRARTDDERKNSLSPGATPSEAKGMSLVTSNGSQ